MSDPGAFLIVGAALAGAKAAQTLREDGFDGEVVLFGEEPGQPYQRPPLSKGLLLGTVERDTVFVHEADWYADHDVDLGADVCVAGPRPRRPAGRAGRRSTHQLRRAPAGHRLDAADPTP
jgi:3-phenylpropionate/trans-cinnamate dioxygenase ferredoxin reductase component